jgi:hypothetical protein
MLPKRRKPDKDKDKDKGKEAASNPLDDQARDLAAQQAKLRAEIERNQRLIEEAPKIRKEQERLRREELVRRASRTDGRRDSHVALQDPRHAFEFNAARPAQQKSLRAARRRGRFLFFVLLCTLAAVVYWAYLTFTAP